MSDKFYAAANGIINSFNARRIDANPDLALVELQKAVSLLKDLAHIAYYSGDYQAAGYISAKADDLRTGAVTPFREIG